MKTPKWLEGIIVFAGDILAAFLGSELAEDKKSQQEIGRQLRKELVPDREDVVKELERLGPEGQEILQLLEEANTRHHGIIVVQIPGGGSKRYTENWVISRLLEIEPKDRTWMFARLNQLCRESQAAFLARLELLHNNWYSQYPRLFLEEVGAGTANFNRFLGQIANWLENQPGGRP